jgi:Protein of unknown function (DUF1064)
MNKYHAQRTVIDGISFASKKEAKYYGELQMAKKAGALKFFLRQIPIQLPGGARYICDFLEFWSDGQIRFVDVKGFKTPIYKLKKKMVEAAYPIKILEV